MSELNQLFLSELSKKYEIDKIEMFEDNFSSYSVSFNKRARIYLILCNNYKRIFDVDIILEKISLQEKSFRMGNSYLCVMPMQKPTIDLCTFCNGKSFVHFIFYDNMTNDLVFDKSIYYLGSKQIKKLMDIYQCCFNDSNVSSGTAEA